LILFIVSTKDIAGMNIAKQLILRYKFKKNSEFFQNHPIYSKTIKNENTKILFVNTEIVETQYLDKLFTPKLFIFLSRHSSAQAIPTLSVHTPGNISEANFGGKPRKVSISSAMAMKNVLLRMAKLRNENNLDYEVCYECTHHGPSLNSPAMFVELGSSLEQWSDTKAAMIVAEAATAAISECSSGCVSVGIGGPHYNKKFSKMALNNQRAFGHIIPKYALSKVDSELIRQCVERTIEKVDSIVLDWKGIKSEYKSKITSAIEAINLNWEKV
jgi:D-aminoacyl-tRNA deacylase